MNAKDNFREGFIMLKRPFYFAELSEGIPPLTILYAYIEKFLYKREMTEEGKQEHEAMSNGGGGMFSGNPKYMKRVFESDEEFEDRMNKNWEDFENRPSNFREIKNGFVVQATIHGVPMNFYPGEYSIVEADTLEMATQGEEYYMCKAHQEKITLKSYLDNVFYLQSRGISQIRAEKMASYGLKDLVYYIPHPELQKHFYREEHIVYTPEFDDYYKQVYGGFEEFKRTC